MTERISDELSGRDELRGVLVRSALATGVCLPRLWRHTGSAVEEPGAHLRMPRLRSPNVDHGRDGDAPVQVAADSMVLGRASHGNPLQWHVGSPARGPARHHVQECLVAGAEAPTIDDRSPARAAGGRGGGRPGRNSVPGRQQLFRSREIREDPYRWRCRGDRPRHKPGQAKAETSEIPRYPVWTYPSRRYPRQLRGFDRSLCAGQREDRNDAAHRRARIVSRAPRLPTRSADGRQDGRPYRAALDSSSLRADEALGARHLSWAAPQAHRHVSQRVCLPVQSALLPPRLVRNHARARLAPSPDELLGYHRARQSPQRRTDSPARAPAPQDSDRHAGRPVKTSRKSRTSPRLGFDPLALDIDQPGTTG